MRQQLAEARAQRAATAEILKVIARSPSDVQPVFDCIVRNASTLCKVPMATAILFDGAMLHLASSSLDAKRMVRFNKLWPMPIARAGVQGVVVRDRKLANVRDVETDARVAKWARPLYRSLKIRSGLWVPMIRERKVVGLVAAFSPLADGFGPASEALLKTFADQAVIAIENARLFNETKEALERQTATGEILASISSSVSDVQPVFDAIARNVLRILGTHFSAVQLVRDGQLHLAGFAGAWFERLKEYFPQPLDAETAATRALKAHRVIQLVPIIGNPKAPARSQKMAKAFGYNAIITVPMMREGKVVGAISTTRREAVPFDEKQEALLKSFADHAAIAIENARLFNETKEALERQTATAEILRVIASSPSDVQPVFDAIAASARRLLDGRAALVARRAGDMLELAAYTSISDAADSALRALFPSPIIGQGHLGKAILAAVPVQVSDFETDDAYSEKFRAMARVRGLRSAVSVPMLREGEPIGVISVNRPVPGNFSEHQTNLLKTFADQAVIAIENVRLFNETREALERQTATAEILKVIASSPASVQPVFDAIASSAMKLVGGFSAVVVRAEGDALHLAALTTTSGSGDEALKGIFPLAIDGQNNVSIAVRTCAPRITADIESDPDSSEQSRTAARARGWRSGLAVPMLRDGRAVGAINVTRRDPGQFADHHVKLLQTFADQAVIAIENVRLFNETREALERQTATAEILKVIASAPADVQPVFDAIVASVARLFGRKAALRTVEAAGLRRRARSYDLVPGEYHGQEVEPLDRSSIVGCAVLDGHALQWADTLVEGAAQYGMERAKLLSFRSIASAPLMLSGRAIGVISVSSPNPGVLSDKQMELMSTFADQAVIAIENVRLFNETRESLERQTATAEILRVISSSPTDTQPVFEAIADASQRLFPEHEVGINLLDEAGSLYIGAVRSPGGDALRRHFAQAQKHQAGTMVKLRRSVAHYPDVDAAGVPEEVRLGCGVTGVKSIVYAPLVLDERGIGSLWVAHRQPRPFAEKEIALLKTFADQAVIAIQNVRSFNETREALERQTATAEVLGVISGSMADARPVFEAITESCARLFASRQVGIFLVGDDGMLHFGAHWGPGREELEALYPMPLASTGSAIAIEERQVKQYPDVLGGPGVPESVRRGCEQTGARSIVIAPMLWDVRGVGAICVARESVGVFTDKEMALLKTFADQAVIAIQNARLFNETKEALERQTATAEILKVIASSPSDVQPVLEAVAASSARLCDAADGVIHLRDGDNLRYAAHYGEITLARPIGETRLISRDSVTGRAALEGRTFHVHDVQSDAAEFPEGADMARRGGFRTALVVPLMRNAVAIGTISIRRTEARPFTEAQIELLKTFADQAVIAIENVRLFNETKESLEQQAAMAEILQVINSSPGNLTPVFDIILEKAHRLCDMTTGSLELVEGDFVRTVAARGFNDRWDQHLRQGYRMTETTGRDFRNVDHTHIRDMRNVVEQFPEESELRAFVEIGGLRTYLGVKLVKDGVVFGRINAARTEARRFTDKQIALLKNFADQAVIAIENVRLFNETKEALERQTATAEIL
ncbi:MAG: GAF domain-containing protein, partial [Betaproteobacteria bacterium]